MAIVQISKIQHRSGNLVDLPQLDAAELGWANDRKRLFIGTSLPNPDENIEVLTSYSNISLSQVSGSGGANLYITAATSGQVMAFDGSNWVNKGGTTGGLITLGDFANVKITGGAIGYVLETDGTGNLSWTSKGTIRTNILALTAATPIVMTVANTTPYTNGVNVTISGVLGTNANTVVNGQVFFVKVANDFPTSGNVTLYTDNTLSTAAVGTGLVANANTGVATTTLGGGGSTAASGANTSLQFNNTNLLDGSANLTYDFAASILALNGNANITGNINTTATVVASKFTSNVTTGVAPLTVASTTLVPNLYAARANVADNSVVTIRTSGLHYPSLVGGSGANYAMGAATALSFNATTGTLSSTSLIGTSNVQSALFIGSGANLTDLNASNLSTGTVPDARITGNYTGINNLTATTFIGSGANLTNLNASNLSSGTLPDARLTGSYTGIANLSATLFIGSGANLTSLNGANISTVGTATTAGTVTTAAQPNITSTGTLSALSVSGTLTTTTITTGLNTTAGSLTGNWSLTAGSKLQATYADLAERYVADAVYESGTVLEFGGEHEVTLATDGTARVAGVVTTNPAYVMNSMCEGEFVAEIALQGRVPCKVRGVIRKGDMLIAGGDGFARPSLAPNIGTIIGKAIQNFDGYEGVIEVAVGRL